MVLHMRLLWKSEYIGRLKGRLKNWKEDYLKGREIRTVVQDEKSEWREVESEVPQESVFAPIMFLVVYVNEMTEGVNNYISLFADDGILLLRTSLTPAYTWVESLPMELESCHWPLRGWHVMIGVRSEDK